MEKWTVVVFNRWFAILSVVAALEGIALIHYFHENSKAQARVAALEENRELRLAYVSKMGDLCQMRSDLGEAYRDAFNTLIHRLGVNQQELRASETILTVYKPRLPSSVQQASQTQ